MLPDQAPQELAKTVTEGLLFPRGVLAILQETRLFGPIIDEAIRQIDEVLEAAKNE